MSSVEELSQTRTRRYARKLLDLIARATDVGLELGVDYMKIWPGQDGFDYPLQADPRRLWELSVEGMRNVAGPTSGAQVRH